MLLAGVSSRGMDYQEDSASDVSPGLLVSLVISSHNFGSRPSPFVPQPRFQAFFPRLYRWGRPGTDAKVVSQLAPGRQLSIKTYYNFSLQEYIELQSALWHL